MSGMSWDDDIVFHRSCTQAQADLDHDDPKLKHSRKFK